MVWEINMGVCPGLIFDNMFGYDFYIYGAFEFLCNSILQFSTVYYVFSQILN